MVGAGDGENESANNLSYPSPGAEGIDTGPFYHSTNRDDEDAQNATTDHQVAAHLQDQEHGHGHEHDHDAMQPHENDVQQQHSARPTNLEELQLAAQLGQGLASAPIMSGPEHAMNVEDPNLRSILPHPEQDSQHAPYVTEPSNPEPMAPQPMPIPPTPQMASHYSMNNDSIPPRKRSKVSRACDECRRKKIKCDAQSDTGDTPCSSCARSSITCLFSRVPQKRGPSKGYIKELADRIHSIEHKLESEGGITHEDLDKFFAPERHRGQSSSGLADDQNRKRPYSSISTGDFSTPVSNRQIPWGSETRPLSSTLDGSHYRNAALAPQPTPLKGDDIPEKSSLEDTPIPDGDDVPELDESMFDEYLGSVQSLLPILPSTKSRQVALLSSAPYPLRSAFVNALSSVWHSSPGNADIASSLLGEWERHDSPRTHAGDIVHMQTLILLVLEADPRALSTSTLLSRAVALAHTMKLWAYTSIDALGEADSDDHLRARLWWSLILLERWQAVGSGRPSLIQSSNVVLPSGLDQILGEDCFYVLRLSRVLSKVATILTSLTPPTSGAHQYVTSVLEDNLEEFREDLPPHVDAASFPLVHMAFWHCRLLLKLLISGNVHAEVFWPTKELADLLLINSNMTSPLIFSFASLVSLALAKLHRLDSNHEDSAQLIKEILGRPGRAFEPVHDRLMELTRPTSSAATAASQGLQHLADLATADQEAPVESAREASLLLGYLNG